ncbi:MAG TPA: DUF3883 domain-containing protein [Myxococcaceae bacterium]|nr:DUF3883 domain-containing protein [Myxococcaceae bacterium]
MGIAKEFLQNADDAGASWVRFALDLRIHPCERLPDPRMRSLLGPALLITSDQVFSETDLQRIQTISQGAKRDQAGKTGRFGVGFNSCYHVTDYPCFATRDRIVCFDPHKDAVSSQEKQPGRWWSLEKLWMDHPDWPRVFDLSEGAASLTRTTFRLPLRTQAQANSQRLSKRPFLVQEALALFDELQRWGGALLLFLRRVLHLEVDILHQDRVEQRLRVTTSAPEAVRAARSRLLETDDIDLSAWLERWRSGQARPREEVYEHLFHVQAPAIRRDDRFLVAGALVSEGQALLEAAEAMVACRERALPWVGAAIQLAPSGVEPLQPAVEERLFCTLPLAQQVDLPFFLNGAFDLNSSRTRLTYHEPHGDQEVRSRWNKALLTEAAPRVVVSLLRALHASLGEQDPTAFYSLWPGPQEAGPTQDLLQAVYRRLSQERFLRVRENGRVRWATASEARAQADWSPTLRSALLADGLPLLDPQPPRNVLEGLATVKASPRPWTAEEMRAWLRVPKDPACPLENAPRAALRERALVVELFRQYGAGERVNRAGLPLALMADGTLRAFHRGTMLFLAPHEVQQLFPNSWHALVDAAFVSETGLQPDAKASLKEADITVIIASLSAQLQPAAGLTWREWTPTSPSPPSTAWLLRVLRYISMFDLRGLRDQLRAMCLLPDQHSRLHRADATTPPLYVHDGTPERLKQALLQFNVPVLAASADLIALLGMTSRRMAPDGKDLLPPLLGEAVALALSPQGVAAASPEARQTLLDWLSDEHGRQRLSSAALDRLKPLRLWEDEDGVPAAANERPLYLPSQYQPPPHLPRYRLLHCGPAERWRPLLGSLGIPALNRSTVVGAVVDELERTSNNARVLEWLRWLREEADRDTLKAEEGEKRADSIWSSLRSRSIIPSADGRRLAMKELYHPDATEVVEVLGPLAHRPAPSLLGDDKQERAHWLEWLRLDRQIRVGDLLERVMQLVAQASVTGTASVEAALLRVLQHLDDEERWKRLHGWQAHGKGPTLAQKLASLAWLPAVSGDQKAVRAAGFVTPADQLYRPSQMFPLSLQHQVASQAPLLAIRPHGKLCEDLELPTEVPLGLAIAHLRYVRDLWERPGHGGLNRKTVHNMSKEFLNRIGQPSQAPVAAQYPGLLDELAGEPCVWHAETQRFWMPGHVFLQRIRGLEPLRVHADATDAEAAGLERLGVRALPGPEDYVSFLHELAALYAGKTLPEDVKRSVLWAWVRLAEEESEVALQGHPPVLTRGGALVQPHRVLEDDAPWWSGRLKDAVIPLLAPDLPVGAARIAGVRRASEEIVEVLLQEASHPHAKVAALAAEFAQHLSRHELQRGLLRLLVHTHDSAHNIHGLEQTADDALALRVVASSTLRTALRCSSLSREELFGEGEADSLLDGNCLLLALMDRETAAHELASVINRRLPQELRLQDLSALEAILRCPPEMIEAVLDRRRIRARAPEPKALDLSDLDPTREAEQSSDTTVPADEDEGKEAGHPSAPDGAPEPARGSRHAQASPQGSPAAPESQQATPAHDGLQIVRPTRGSFSATSTTSSGPPITPGDGTSHVSTPQRRGRLRSYLHRAGSSFSPGLGTAPEASIAINLAALQYVSRDALNHGCQVSAPSPSHPGYTVQIEVPGEAAPRCVAVRGLTGAWDRAGIPLTRTELREAQDKGDRYWLYVVEYALDSEKLVVTRVQDPWGKVDEFRFDDGWRDAADVPPRLTPAAGFMLYEGETLLGEIIEVIKMGPLQCLRLHPPEGEPRLLAFDPSQHRLAVQEHAHGPHDP